MVRNKSGWKVVKHSNIPVYIKCSEQVVEKGCNRVQCTKLERRGFELVRKKKGDIRRVLAIRNFILKLRSIACNCCVE
jgi:hypothetical protein